MGNKMDEETNIEKMILEGVIELVGIDEETGEFLYTFTDKLQEMYPLLYDEAQTHFSNEMMFLWENDFIEMDITEHNPLVRITEKALDPDEVESLDPEIRSTLKEVIRILFVDL
jgi:hypothetical protein